MKDFTTSPAKGAHKAAYGEKALDGSILCGEGACSWTPISLNSTACSQRT